MEYDLEAIVKDIIEKTGLSRKEIEERVKQKREDMKGLINEQSATIIVAKELGISVTPQRQALPQTDVDIRNLSDQMKSVTVRGRVIQIFPVRHFKRKDGTQGAVASVIIADDTGDIRMVLWDELTRAVSEHMLEVGTIVRLHGGYTKRDRRGQAIEIHAGMKSKLEIDPEDIPADAFQKFGENAPFVPIVQINLTQRTVNTQGLVVKKNPPNSFTRKDGSPGQVASLILRDDTGETRVTFWNDRVADFEQIPVGAKVKFYTVSPRQSRLNPQALDLHLGQSSKFEIEETQVIQQDELLQKIHEIKNTQKIASVQGEVVASEGVREIQKRDGTTTHLFGFTVADDTAAIRVAVWGEGGRTLANDLVIGSSIQINNASVRENTYRGELELSVNDAGNVEVVDSLPFSSLSTGVTTGTPSAQGQGGGGTASVMKIASISRELRLASIQGKVSLVEGLRDIQKKDGTTTHLFSFSVTDDTGTIRVAAWGDDGVSLADQLAVEQPVQIANARVRYNDYRNNVELSLNDANGVTLLDDLPFTPREGPTDTSAGGSSTTGGQSFTPPSRHDILAVEDQEDRSRVEVRGMVIRTNVFRYDACPNCNRKKENCTCGDTNPPVCNIIVSLTLEDDTESIDVKFFRDRAEELLGTDSALIGDMDEEDFVAIKEEFNSSLVGKELVVQGRAQFSTYNNRKEITAFSQRPLDPVDESRRLLSEIKST